MEPAIKGFITAFLSIFEPQNSHWNTKNINGTKKVKHYSGPTSTVLIKAASSVERALAPGLTATRWL